MSSQDLSVSDTSSRYIKNLKTIINFDLQTLPQNKLSQVIKYSIGLLSEKDYCLALLIPMLGRGSKSYHLGVSILYNLSACYTVYDLEHMLNKNMRNKKPSCHILFGETVSQLAAICTLTKSSDIIIHNNNIENKLKISIMELFYSLNLDEQEECSQMEQIVGIKNNKDKLIALINENLVEKKTHLIFISLQICLILQEKKMEDTIIKKISNFILELVEYNRTYKEKNVIFHNIISLTQGTCLETNIEEYLKIF